jgi:hypothetical protein
MVNNAVPYMLRGLYVLAVCRQRPTDPVVEIISFKLK